MNSSPIIVRSLVSEAELDLHCYAAAQAFSSDPSPENIARWKNFFATLPDYRPEMLRVALLDGVQVGSCIIFERQLRMGAARLATGCIGAVVTYPDHRQKGVATALMLDAIEYARAHNYSLLQLDGIPNFYYRYGYTDMFDVAVQDISSAALMALPASSYTVRPASLDDAAALLALYDRHFGAYSSTYERSLEQQVHLLQNRSAENPPLLALDPDGTVKGYVHLLTGERRAQGHELAVDDWQAAVALLQHHVCLFEDGEIPAFLSYRLPPTGYVAQRLIDTLRMPVNAREGHAALDWAVRGQSYHQRFAGWMARLIDLSTLAEELLPEWQDRWQRSLVSWSGDIELVVDNEACTLRIDGEELSLIDGPGIASDTVCLTPQNFVQTLFGYRPIASFLQEQATPADLLTVLNVLFPTGHTWIPSSDWF